MDNQSLPREIHDWTETKLYDKNIKGKEPISGALGQIMPVIQRILASGGTQLTDFTLHDAGHAFRVAERMVDIIPDDVLPNLSLYELAFLLLSAYLHDIGMTPEQKKVNNLYEYMTKGTEDLLSVDEKENLQKWLDDNGYDINLPLSEGELSFEKLDIIKEIITHYCRYCHNDWSAEWIKANLNGFGLGSYEHWIDDIITLCKSHHEGYNELIKDKFDPQPIGTEFVHLRYLATVLCIADILEFDPERTPEVIFRHRNISDESKIYWWKDHYISLVIEENKRLVVYSKPPNAYVHRAIENMIDQIDEELMTCQRIADEKHFEKCPGLQRDLPHYWSLQTSVHRHITPKDNAYEYIDGSFRPNTKKVLEMLSGTQLYGTPFAAVRELLQNAFDAVREQIAYERLLNDNPSDKTLEQTLARLKLVELLIEEEDDRIWLVCKDTGVGMTKRIIRDHLLVSGNARRHDVLDLERKCKDKGFELVRSGQFGIGILSYFMLADKVVIKTRRSQYAGDSEINGWIFETEGIGTFGELRKDSSLTNGTEIRLRLKKDMIKNDISNWFHELQNYIKDTLLYIPCKFRMKSQMDETSEVEFAPGWTYDESYFLGKLLEIISLDKKESINLYSINRQNELLQDSERIKRIKENMEQCIRWEVSEGELSNNMGNYRIHLPYYMLDGGFSLAFFLKSEEKIEYMIEKGVTIKHGFIGQGKTINGWRGMQYESRFGPEAEIPFFLEINWTSTEAGKISVNRNSLNFSQKAKDIWDWLRNEISLLSQHLAERNADSIYHSINCCLTGINFSSEKAIFWLNNDNQLVWKQLTFPTTSEHDFLYSLSIGTKIMWKDKEVSIAPDIKLKANGQTLVLTLENLISPDRIAICDNVGIFQLWIGDHPTNIKHHSLVTAEFPDIWNPICGIQNFPDIIYNRKHPLICKSDKDSLKWLDRFSQQIHQGNFDPLSYKTDLLNNRNLAASWVLYFCFTNLFHEFRRQDMWNGLNEREPRFLKDLWNLIFENGENTEIPILFLAIVQNGFKIARYLHIITPEKWELIYDENEIEKRIPYPGPEWHFEVFHAE